MQNSQVSTWVPILVAIIGIISVIAGQIVNGWRDSRLWRREKEKEEAKLNHANILDWRKIRIEAYNPIIQHMDKLEPSFVTVKRPKNLDGIKLAAHETHRHYVRIAEDASKLELIGSTETADVSQYLTEILGNIAVHLDHLWQAASDVPEDDPEAIDTYLNEARELMEEDFNRVSKVSKDLKNLFRKDLGISSLESQER